MNRFAILLIAAILAAMSSVAPGQMAIQRSVNASGAVRIFAPPVRSAIERAADFSRYLRIFASSTMVQTPFDPHGMG